MSHYPTHNELIDALREVITPDNPVPHQTMLTERLHRLLYPLSNARDYEFIAGDRGVRIECLRFKTGEQIGIGTARASGPSMEVLSITPSNPDHRQIAVGHIQARVMSGSIIAKPITT